TTLAVAALASADEDVRELGCLDWILGCQHRENPAFGPSARGGWSWTARPGGVPTVDDTAGALIALQAWMKNDLASQDHQRIEVAASGGVKWLLEAQGSDGGWPTFGASTAAKGTLGPSGCDVTAHALRALGAWRATLVKISDNSRELRTQMDERMTAAIDRGLRFLAARQHADGSWPSLRCHHQRRAGGASSIHATCQALTAYRDLGRLTASTVPGALEWLMSMKRSDGSWGGGVGVRSTPAAQGSVEETALAVDTLSTCGQGPAHEAAAGQGLEWLIDAVQANLHQARSPLEYIIARHWFSERLSPLVGCVATLGRLARTSRDRSEPPRVAHGAKQ
ncbi:MAG TPA: prenyltransferase/squalene oxidase repeat-containing protein, partial [Pirellulales bacterium]|nr:prenyltransferase/squalene oxidase repeat-containing protein [Pirellulales bacterium]